MDKITIKSPFTKIVPQVTDDLKDVESISFDVESLSQVSDGYHTIAELYDHRVTLWIKFCQEFSNRLAPPEWEKVVWRSKLHSDGTEFEGWFVLGMFKESGKQMTYHLPNSRWDDTSFADTLDKAPEWDGHTSADVLERLKTL